jgi:arylsulfatase A
MNRRHFLRATSATALGSLMTTRAELSPPPNIVLILADDLGYGDLHCYGSRIQTPNLDRMASEGAMFSNFYAASPVCSPSRASVLTGRYGVRCGIRTALQPTDTIGLPSSETTIAQMLKPAGYSTMCVGKWHLGSTPGFLPTNHGFDGYYGIPYSNDQSPSVLMQNTTVIESPVNLTTITQRYTTQAINFIRQSKNKPFFLYLPHTAPHIPLAASPNFLGKSSMGLYGDVVEELDWSVGQVLQELQADGLDSNTLVVFTSDNGPWFQGSPGRLRGRKGDTFEGGMREPFIARFPGKIPANRTVKPLASTLDFLPTIAGLTNAALPANPLDGVDMWPLLTGQGRPAERPPFLYFADWNLQCARIGRWKLHLARYNTPAYTPMPQVGYYNLRLLNPELYDIESDPEEAEDTSANHPDIVADIRTRVEQMLPAMPAQVQAAWQDTQNRPVYPNDAGSWPQPIQQ